MIKHLKKHWWWLAILLFVLVLLFWMYARPATANPQQLARCLKQSGAIFYGSKNCGHCQNTKEMFGGSASDLPYVECVGSDGQQIARCIEQKIIYYPTWVLADGSRRSGEISLSDLARWSGCR
jgi:hypothetical protein